MGILQQELAMEVLMPGLKKNEEMQRMFYTWAFQNVNDGEKTHPLNWINLSQMFMVERMHELFIVQNRNKIIEEFKNHLVNRRFKYTVAPYVLERKFFKNDRKALQEFIEQSKNPTYDYPIYQGVLSYSKGKFLLNGFHGHTLALEDCWIINPIND